MSEEVTYERRGDLALITLDRPDRRNAQFSLHQLAHAHNINLTGGNPMLVGLDDLRSTGGSRAS